MDVEIVQLLCGYEIRCAECLMPEQDAYEEDVWAEQQARVVQGLGKGE
jgi:hypothetical protein